MPVLYALALGAFAASLQIADAADQALSRLPVVGRVRGVVVDTLLGRPETFEYVSTTTPTDAPPTL